MKRIVLALAILASLIGCSGNGGSSNSTELVFYGLTASGQLVRFPASDVTDITNIPITGVAVGTIGSIDYRQSDGMLYGRSSNGALYRIDPETGVATAYGTPLRPGAVLAADFIPNSEYIRYVGESQANLRVSGNDGTVLTDTTLAWAPGDVHEGDMFSVIAVADNGTTVYAIDGFSEVLVSIGTPESPTTGLMHTIGFMGFDVSDQGAALEFAPDGTLYAAMRSDTAPFSSLYRINTSTAQRTWVGTILTEFSIRSLTSRME